MNSGKGSCIRAVGFVLAAFLCQMANLQDLRCQALPDPPGSFMPVSATEVASIPTWATGDRLVAAYYFYWYKWKDGCAGELCDPAYNRSHIEFATGYLNSKKPLDALTSHPVDLKEWDFDNPAWHSTQIDRMLSAGIDILLPVFWGVPGRYGKDGHVVAAWSERGLKALAAALDKREKEGKPNPRIGMFYDTSTLTFESPFNYQQGGKIDLKTEAGWKHFYATIRDFYSLVPHRFWALWEKKPLVWLYASEFASGHDSHVLGYAREHFAQEFGGAVPLFIAHSDWSQEAGADWIYQWGGAIKPTCLSINSVGPGFDNSAVHGLPRGSKVLREREDSRFYREAWEHALRSPAPITVVETWNELHEGTEICPTVEYGDEYLRITADYARAFKKGIAEPLPGPWRNAERASWTARNGPQGIEAVQAEDGAFRTVETREGNLIETIDSYLYFRVEDSFAFATRDRVKLEVEIFEVPTRPGQNRFGGTDAVHVEYDSWDLSAGYHGMYKSSESVALSGRVGWKTVAFELPGARLANNQNQSADFRLVVPKGLRVGQVTMTR